MRSLCILHWYQVRRLCVAMFLPTPSCSIVTFVPASIQLDPDSILLFLLLGAIWASRLHRCVDAFSDTVKGRAGPAAK